MFMKILILRNKFKMLSEKSGRFASDLWHSRKLLWNNCNAKAVLLRGIISPLLVMFTFSTVKLIRMVMLNKRLNVPIRWYDRNNFAFEKCHEFKKKKQQIVSQLQNGWDQRKMEALNRTINRSSLPTGCFFFRFLFQSNIWWIKLSLSIEWTMFSHDMLWLWK